MVEGVGGLGVQQDHAVFGYFVLTGIHLHDREDSLFSWGFDPDCWVMDHEFLGIRLGLGEISLYLFNTSLP